MSVIVVEDEAVVLLELSMALEDLGYELAGSASGLDDGIALSSAINADIAVLDIDLEGRESWPIAEILTARGIPFVLVSGYTKAVVPAEFANHPFLSKPYSTDALRVALQSASIDIGRE